MRTGGLTAWKVAVAGIVTGLGVLGAAESSLAQSGNRTQWGVRATVSPAWSIPERVFEIEALDGYLGPGSDVRGSELALGFVRGRRFGGDWGLAYMRKNLSDSTRIEVDNGSSCVNAVCGENRDVYRTNDAVLHGLELHGFVPWFMIKRRAQVGMNLGIGAVTFAGGTITKNSRATDVIVDPVTGQPMLVPSETITQLDGKAFLEDLGVPTILPVVKLELALTGILTRNLKVRATGGVNLPGVQRFTATLVYLFGS